MSSTLGGVGAFGGLYLGWLYRKNKQQQNTCHQMRKMQIILVPKKIILLLEFSDWGVCEFLRRIQKYLVIFFMLKQKRWNRDLLLLCWHVQNTEHQGFRMLRIDLDSKEMRMPPDVDK